MDPCLYLQWRFLLKEMRHQLLFDISLGLGWEHFIRDELHLMQSPELKQLRECNSLPRKLSCIVLSFTRYSRKYVTSTNKSLAAVPERAAGTKLLTSVHLSSLYNPWNSHWLIYKTTPPSIPLLFFPRAF